MLQNLAEHSHVGFPSQPLATAKICFFFTFKLLWKVIQVKLVAAAIQLHCLKPSTTWSSEQSDWQGFNGACASPSPLSQTASLSIWFHSWCIVGMQVCTSVWVAETLLCLEKWMSSHYAKHALHTKAWGRSTNTKVNKDKANSRGSFELHWEWETPSVKKTRF